MKATNRKINHFTPETMTPNLEQLISEVEMEIKSEKNSKTYNNVHDFLIDLKS